MVPGDSGTDHHPLQLSTPSLKTVGFQGNPQPYIDALVAEEFSALIEFGACAGVDHAHGCAGLREQASSAHA